MDAELKQAFDSLTEKIDDLKKSIEKTETSRSLDHDKLIRLEGGIEAAVAQMNQHCANEKEYGKLNDDRLRQIDEKLLKYGIAITVIASAAGGGAGKLVSMIFGG